MDNKLLRANPFPRALLLRGHRPCKLACGEDALRVVNLSLVLAAIVFAGCLI